jgi:hypothetical protein
MESKKKFEGYLDQIIAQMVDQEIYQIYIEAKQSHFRKWKYYHISEQQTLQLLRKILYLTGVLTINREAGWKINRSLSEYDEVLGGHIGIMGDSKAGVRKQRISGRSDPEETFNIADSGPGNCRALYEGMMPGLSFVGWGREILFSVDGTLNNCLRIDLQFEENGLRDAYISQHFFEYLTALEVLSVFEFLISEQPSLIQEQHEVTRLFSFLGSLCESQDVIIDLSILKKMREDIQSTIKRLRNEIHDNEGATITIMLGLLIDELISRLDIPNGMGFWYKKMEKLLSVILQKYRKLQKEIAKTGGNEKKLKKDLTDILSVCHHINSVKVEQQEWSQEWCDKVDATANLLRNIGFVARQKGILKDEDINLIFVVANELWRWIFFLEHRNWTEQEFNNTQYQVEAVLRWLRRPWGIINLEDVEYIYRGLVSEDDNGELPLAFGVLIDFLRSEIELYVPTKFGFKNATESVRYCKRFVERRLLLAKARRRVMAVRVDDPALIEEATHARTIIDLLTMWLYKPEKKSYLDGIEQDLNELERLLRDGAWLDEFGNEIQEILTKKQRDNIRLYLSNPNEFVSRLFLLGSPDFEICEHIDVFPPETFCFEDIDGSYLS